MAGDPLQHRAHADLIVERAATQLRDLLKALVREFDPFPIFPGSMFSYGIEVDGAQVEGDRGCVVLGEDGELYELQIGLDMDALAAGASEPALSRQEQRVPLEGVAPADYVAYAHRAVTVAVEHLLTQVEGGA